MSQDSKHFTNTQFLNQVPSFTGLFSLRKFKRSTLKVPQKTSLGNSQKKRLIPQLMGSILPQYPYFPFQRFERKARSSCSLALSPGWWRVVPWNYLFLILLVESNPVKLIFLFLTMLYSY